MPYAISWRGYMSNEVKNGPILYKFVEVKGKDTRKKVPKTLAEAEAFCERANEDQETWGGVEHSVVKVNRENIERENSDEKILGRKFWRENFDIMMEGRKNENKNQKRCVASLF